MHAISSKLYWHPRPGMATPELLSSPTPPNYMIDMIEPLAKIFAEYYLSSINVLYAIHTLNEFQPPNGKTSK